MESKIGKTTITIIHGDITQQETEAIVNAANTTLLGGGGVDGAIHRAGGPRIIEECKRILAKQGGCPTGKAVITTGGDLKAKWVVHTVGPVWSGGKNGEDQLLRNAYHNSLQLAKEKGIHSISFPSISTGAYRFPIERASRIALSTVLKWCRELPPDTPKSHHLDEVRFVLFTEMDLKVYESTWNEMQRNSN